MKNKNIKSVFLLVTLVFLLVGLTALSAADTSSNSTDVSTSSVSSVSDSLSSDTLATSASDNKNTVTTKTIKSEEETVNYYVSDSKGSDDNTGKSEDTAFKTIEKAINSTTSNGVYNIHIAEGVYKGIGNTNLTVSGNNHINFIRTGINKTVFDGEANYTIRYGDFVWGSSDVWRYYDNGTGNWFMNITEGNGKITITNMTFQKGWVKGGSATSLYKIAPIDNYATLNVDNVYFYSNFCGVGSALRNRPGATLTVNNSIFDSNRKSDSTGNAGIIYNNGTAYVYNSLFTDNYARWGSVTNDRDLSVINCTFRNGIAYDGNSGFKSGTGIYMNTGSLDYFVVYDVEGIKTLVENCTFENNQQCDVHIGFGQATIRGNVFNKSTGIYEVSAARSAKVNLTVTHLIENNQFINMQPSTLLATMLTTTTPSFAFYSTALGYNTTIINNTIDVPNVRYGYGLRLTGYANVINNTMNNYIAVEGNNNTITGNTINTNKEYTIIASNSRLNNTVTNNTLITEVLKGDLSVDMNTTKNTVENNLPKADIITITNENYANYFNNDGTIKNGAIISGNKVIFSGKIINKKFIFDDVKLLVTSENTNATLINSTIMTRNNAAIMLNDVTINNTDSTLDYAILLNSTKNKITKSKIIVNTTNTIHALVIDADENTINGTTIDVVGPSLDVDWSGYPVGLGKNIGLLIRSSNNLIASSTITVKTQANGTTYGSVYGIEIQSPDATKTVTGNEITSTRVTVTGDMYAYALNIVRADNTITDSNSRFTATSNNTAYALQLSGPAKNNEFGGYATVTATTNAYGAYVTGQWSGTITNTTFNKYIVQNINSENGYGIVIECASNINISNTWNEGHFYGNNGIIYSLTNTNNSYIYWGTRYMHCENPQFALITDSRNLTMYATSMYSNNGEGVVIVNSSDINITGNKLNIGNVTCGNDAVTSTNSTDVTIEANTPVIGLLTEDTYNTYFDENSVIRDNINVTYLVLGGDLYNHDLIFNKTIEMRNAGNYTIYNGTIIARGNISGITIDGPNINNVNKPAIITDLNNTIQSNICIYRSKITVTGDNVTAVISERKSDTQLNTVYLYQTNIILKGKNATVVYYTGNVTGNTISGQLRIARSNITVQAEDNSIVFNANAVDMCLDYNNVSQSGKNVITILANEYALYYQYSGFSYNNVSLNGDNVSVIYATNKIGSRSGYFQGNNINLTSNNPITAITLDGRNNYVSQNNITINTYNKNTPVVSVVNNSRVTDNYISAYDVCGNAAVEAIPGVTISGNTPEYVQVIVTMNDITGFVNQENTITAKVTDLAGNNNVEGLVTFTNANGKVIGTATIDNGVATIDYVPSHIMDSTITVTYTGNGVYDTKNTTANIVIKRLPTTIKVDPVTAYIGDVITLTATITDSENNAITNGKVIFKVNGKTLRDAEGNTIYATVKDGKYVVENITVLSGWAKTSSVITAVYGGYGDFESSRINTTFTVTKREVKATVDSVTTKAGETVTFTVKLTDNITVTGGKVVFKLNGKTLRDDNGNVLYGTVTDGVAKVTYTLPAKMSAKTYTLTSVFSSGIYNRAEANATLTVTK
ncbi:Ig-like domain repeat protein [Methanosphaera sp. WGK6]|uniref:beta strand repeat-containing protein n=1 Tax=Methanosphaera sp. WGK6 TaxID=1561964 RepID=UPI00084BE70D|nr:Ig-like domain repeat protein [Methanosphaera sp. WGK6]OED30034.1 hypothetical protein NL43_04750 [Methanosphaera sp. WGK6]